MRLCLKSLEHALNPKLNYEILVVDISSEIETENVVLEEFPKIKLLPFKNNIGYTKGVNEGIKGSSGEYFLILNSDIVPPQKLHRNVAGLHEKTQGCRISRTTAS